MTAVLHHLRRFLRIERAFFQNCLVRDLQYRGNFTLVFFMDVVWYAVNLAFFKIIYLNTDRIAGYSEDEIYFFMATTFLVDALDMSFFASGLWVLGDQIRKGDFDMVLTKPVSPLMYASMRYVSVGSLLDLGFASLLLALAWINLSPATDALSVAAYFALLLCGLVIMVSFQIAFAAVGFIFVNASTGLQMGFHHLYQFALRPESIYKGPLRFILTYIVPMMVISAIPARMILRGFDWQYFFIGIGAALLSFTLATKFFYFALSRYESASS